MYKYKTKIIQESCVPTEPAFIRAARHTQCLDFTGCNHMLVEAAMLTRSWPRRTHNEYVKWEEVNHPLLSKMVSWTLWICIWWLSVVKYDWIWSQLLPCVCSFMCVSACFGLHWYSVSVGHGGDRSGWSPLLFLKQMHLQLAFPEEREGKHAAGVEICFGSSALMALDLCRRLWLNQCR